MQGDGGNTWVSEVEAPSPSPGLGPGPASVVDWWRVEVLEPEAEVEPEVEEEGEGAEPVQPAKTGMAELVGGGGGSGNGENVGLGTRNALGDRGGQLTPRHSDAAARVASMASN